MKQMAAEQIFLFKFVLIILYNSFGNNLQNSPNFYISLVMTDQILFKYTLKQAQHIWEVDGLSEVEYDYYAEHYDKLISNKWYNRIMWGNSPSSYAQFLEKNIINRKPGPMADVGCGTLSFTASVYADYTNDDPLFLCDHSVQSLDVAHNRLQLLDYNNQSVHFLRADALDLPFRDNTLQTVFSFGILHLLDVPEKLFDELFRIIKKKGDLHISSLCTDRDFSQRYLQLLYKKGHVAKPKSSDDIVLMLQNAGFKVTTVEINGGMAYFSALKI